MKKNLIVAALAAILLAGCAGANRNRDRDIVATPNPPVNPYSSGGFSDPGPNYPPTGP